MTSESCVLEAIGLQRQIHDLLGRFSGLAKLAQHQVVERLTHGEAPDATTLQDLDNAIREFRAVTEKASVLGITNSTGMNLAVMLERIGEVIERESWASICGEYRPLAERMLRIAHTSGQAVTFLQELHDRAWQCVEDLSLPSPPAETSRETWEIRTQPFRDLWCLLNDPDSLGDVEAEELLGRLEQDFGRSLVSAITLRRLVVEPDDSDRATAAMPRAECEPIAPKSAATSIPTTNLVGGASATSAPTEVKSLAPDDTSGGHPLGGPVEMPAESIILVAEVASPRVSEPEVPAPAAPASEPEHPAQVPSSPEAEQLVPVLPASDLEHRAQTPPTCKQKHPASAPSSGESEPRSLPPPISGLQSPAPKPPTVPPQPDDTSELEAELLPELSINPPEPEPVLDMERWQDIRGKIWQMVAADRPALAYQIARCAEAFAPPGLLQPSSLWNVVVLGPAVRSASGEIVEHLRKNVQNLQAWLPSCQGPEANQETTAIQLVLFGLSLRPTLLAPEAGVLSVLQAVTALDAISPALGEIRRGVAEFGSLNLELSPTVLKGVCDHAVWQQDLDALRAETRGWLDSNRQANIIYAPTTDVWHDWLNPSRPLGRTLETVINQVGRMDEVRQTVRQWSDRRHVERELNRTDERLRKVAARRRPIEARARTAICSRVQEFLHLAQRWLDLLSAEPRSLDDFRQKQADRCRSVVQRFLNDALSAADDLGGAAGASAALTGAVRFLRTALEDLGHLFDASREESAHVLPVRVLLGEELLMLPACLLDENWLPSLSNAEAILQQLEELAETRYDPETAFAIQSEAKDHRATAWVIEALEARPEGKELAARLRLQRDQAVQQCRQAIRCKLDETRGSIEQAVCYDLITDEERNRFLGVVEEGRLLLDEISDFAAEECRLENIDRLILDKRQQRVGEVEQKLRETADSIVPGCRDALEIVRQTLDRGDFLSANEYIELLRTGQPLDRVVEPARNVIADFFPAFVLRFNAFMEGDGRSRPEARDVVERIREAPRGRGRTIGPIDMHAVPGPQAAEAAEMLMAWLRLKNRSPAMEKDLTTLLTGLGFRDVRVNSVPSVSPPHWSLMCQATPLGDPTVCIVPRFGSQAKGRYHILGLFDRPDEEAIVNLVRKVGGVEPIMVLYFGRMTEQRRRDLAELCWQRGRSFLVIDESLVFFLCGERFSRLPILFQCALPFTVAEPYTTTASLVPVEMFFGREQERRAVIDPYGTNLVYGGRQLGKSALLRDVERREHNPGQERIVRWIDLKNRGIGIDRPAEDLWAVLGQELHQEDVLPRRATAHQTVVEKIKEWLNEADNRRILLLLDEADAFLDADSRAVNEQTRHSFPQVARLKGLMDDTDRRFKVVFAGLHNVQRAARDPNTPVAHLGTPVCIGPLLDNGEWRQARDLIEIPFRHMGYEFQPPDLWMRILSYTNYYPSLIQVFCKHLLEYLHNRDRTTFDFQTCPPYPITAQQIEDVYQSEKLQGEIRDKFELTLGLDERYRLIALCIALASIEQRETQSLVEGFDVAWVREQALSWWASGFATDTSYELFRTILDEMVGLGVLRRAAPDRYALRSPNVLNLLGSKTQIEHRLIDVANLPPTPGYEAASLRRSLHADCWRRSPLTAEQEGSLIERSNGVVVLCGSPLSGLADLPAALKEIPAQEGVQFAGSLRQPGQFMEWLQAVDKGRAESEGVTLAVVTADSTWSPSWVGAAADYVRRKTGSTKRFLRVVFVADSDLAWQWSDERMHRRVGATEISLKPWREAALRRWMADAEFGPEAVSSCGEILERTGGWGMLVHALGEACRGCPHTWREQLDKLAAGWPCDPRWNGYCELPRAVLPVLRVMADFGGPISSEDLAEFAPDEDVLRVLRWTDWLSYAREVESDRWILDPLWQSVVTARG
jgi:hypothetical protein